jgi:transcription elongation factor Elf1
MTKVCTVCGEEKALSDFHKMTTGRGGLMPRCKVCNYAKARAWQLANPDRVRAQNKAWKDAHREQVREAERNRRRERPYDPAAARARAQRRSYGITPDVYEEMYADQMGECLICGRYHDVLCIDHCHATGKIRGLLCRSCNSGIGQLGDDPDRIRKALDYLRDRS